MTLPPLFLVGAARSGTTAIGDVLAAHPDVAYWVEPKYVWRHGKHGAKDDVRTPDEATAEVVTFIRGRFEEFRGRAGRPQFVEKTPSNCFRVGFMHRVFPEGRFLHVLRDGRDAAASALRRWTSAPDDRALARRLRRFEIPIAALHHYLPDMLRETVLRRLRPTRGFVWGPRYPGLAAQLGKVDVATLCAQQWAHSVRASVRELAAIPPAQVHTFRYEDFVRAPTEHVAQILRFAGLRADPAVSAAAHALHEGRIGAHAQLPPEQRARIEAVCRPVMQELRWPGFAA